MDALTSAGLGARRNEDIALDLLKFVAATAGVGKPAAPSTGFTGTAATKPDEHVTQLLELYGRCLKAVEGKGPGTGVARYQAGTNSGSPWRVPVRSDATICACIVSLKRRGWAWNSSLPSNRIQHALPTSLQSTEFLLSLQSTGCFRPISG
jgi:hypothetical protein